MLNTLNFQKKKKINKNCAKHGVFISRFKNTVKINLRLGQILAVHTKDMYVTFYVTVTSYLGIIESKNGSGWKRP